MSGSYEGLRRFHEKGFEHLSEALRIDEHYKEHDSKKLRAIEHYRSGICALEEGIKIPIQRSSMEYEKSERLRQKMQTNLDMARERLIVLEKLKDDMKSSEGSRIRPLSGASFMAGPSGSQSARHTSPLRTDHRPKQAKSSHSAANDRKARFADTVRSTKGVDSKLGHLILDNVLDVEMEVSFDDIAGLENAKRALHEAVILPALKPEIFTGLRSPVQGILLFGPPGTGKTLLAKAVASEAKCTFFNISASALTSKWIGESEKLVKALFILARSVQPAVIFVDEIDSILCERKDSDNECSRRLKTEFLLQFDGVGTGSADRVLVMGATNRPFDLDEALLRRFPKRIFVSLPDELTRLNMLQKLLSSMGRCPLNNNELQQVARLTDGYSGSDLKNVAKDAAMGPVREITPEQLKMMQSSQQLRPISVKDFKDALQRVRPSINLQHMQKLIDFNTQFGDISAV